MVIVPEDDTLEVTALVQNKDIGFINVGQNAIIKVEVFLTPDMVIWWVR